MRRIKHFLLQNGYLQINKTNGFYKLNHDFYMAVYFQRKSDGSSYFLNVGIQPMFLLNNQNGVIEEVDCVLRTRIGKVSALDVIPEDEQEIIISELHQFSSQYSDYKSIFYSLSPDELAKGHKVLAEFSITQINLCRLYVEYYHFLNKKETALLFANYGLSIASKLAVTPKRFFKEYIKLNNILS